MENARAPRKILRSPSVKRKNKVPPVNQRVQLERVLGLTGTSNAGLCCDSNSGTIAYPAGSISELLSAVLIISPSTRLINYRKPVR
ncbi:hypothetical protein RRG08_007390 [Elysia crispata]|uniref:Uncharacterized protein n=1 Tax=Elysia crispata TaxID=231223 RepID=A0AAE1E3M5_9GAST|nr:hypothetical protein RRG08_007390 [Elysia crispata]